MLLIFVGTNFAKMEQAYFAGLNFPKNMLKTLKIHFCRSLLTLLLPPPPLPPRMAAVN